MKTLFDLWDAVWPTIAILWIIFAGSAAGILLRELWRECEDCRIDEQCGHDWNPETQIQDEIE